MRLPISQKGFSQVLLLVLLVAGIGVGGYLVQQQTNILPFASETNKCNLNKGFNKKTWTLAGEKICNPKRVGFRGDKWECKVDGVVKKVEWKEEKGDDSCKPAQAECIKLESFTRVDGDCKGDLVSAIMAKCSNSDTKQRISGSSNCEKASVLKEKAEEYCEGLPQSCNFKYKLDFMLTGAQDNPEDLNAASLGLKLNSSRRVKAILKKIGEKVAANLSDVDYQWVSDNTDVAGFRANSTTDTAEIVAKKEGNAKISVSAVRRSNSEVLVTTHLNIHVKEDKSQRVELDVDVDPKNIVKSFSKKNDKPKDGSFFDKGVVVTNRRNQAVTVNITSSTTDFGFVSSSLDIPAGASKNIQLYIPGNKPVGTYEGTGTVHVLQNSTEIGTIPNLDYKIFIKK